MRNARRMRRLARAAHRPAGSLNLTSLMDIFTILLLYLLVNQSDVSVTPPQDVTLPQSIVETKPRETLVVSVSGSEVLVKGERVALMSDVVNSTRNVIEPIRARMQEIRESSIGIETQAEDQNTEVTILADKAVHYSILKRIMISCTAAGYTKISLAVNQK